MKTKIAHALIICMVVFAFGVSFYYSPQLPDRVVSHWNAAGQPDGYSSKFWGVFLVPIILWPFWLLFWLLPKIDPLRANIEKFRPQYNLLLVMLFGFFVYIHILTILWNLGRQFNFIYAIVPPFAILWFVIGSILPHTQRNWFVGIRTPWTLSSDEVWRKTHVLGGNLFKGSAVISLLGLAVQEWAIWLVIVPVIASTLWLLIFSYLEFRKEHTHA